MSRPPVPWRKARALDAHERRLLWRAALLVPAIHIGVRVVGFNRIQRYVDARAPRSPHAPLAPTDAARLATTALNRVKCYSLLPGNCLSQSLALVWLLRREGLSPSLRIGARRQGTALDAHAWVEYDGRVLNDTPDVHTRYAAFADPIRRA